MHWQQSTKQEGFTYNANVKLKSYLTRLLVHTGQLDFDGLPDSMTDTASAYPALERRSHAVHPQGNVSAPSPAPEAHAGKP